MSEPKVTRENEHLEWLNDRLKEEYDRHSRHYYAIKNALIEHGPEVSREFVEKYANRISIATTWNGQNVRILKRAFREAGVTVKKD